MVQISGGNSKPFWSIRSERVTKIPPPSPPLSKDEGLTDIGHSMNIGSLILGVSGVMVSYLIHYGSLLQNATDIITKCDSYFITKCDRSLFQNAAGFLLQNATVLFQNATVITDCHYFITTCNSCYKTRRLLQIATVQGLTKLVFI